jgi:Porin-like glycoporin RafY
MNTTPSRSHLPKIALATALLACGSSHAEFNANIEFDNTYQNQNRGLSQGGRVELNAFGKAGANYFIAGKAAFLAKKDGSAATDDMWVQFGSSTVDLKLGRFEAGDLFPIPRDALVMYANNDGGSSVYRANALRGRFGNASNGQGFFHAAGTANLGGGLSLELGVVETKATDTKGIRPVLTYANGPLTAKLGVEAIKWAGTGRSETGLGLTGAYDFSGIKPILNFAMVKDGAGNKQQTFGLIVDTAFGATVGYIHGVTQLAAGDYETDTFYAAYTMPLFDIKNASMTVAGSLSTGKGTNTSSDEKGVKVRFNYGF